MRSSMICWMRRSPAPDQTSIFAMPGCEIRVSFDASSAIDISTSFVVACSSSSAACSM